MSWRRRKTDAAGRAPAAWFPDTDRSVDPESGRLRPEAGVSVNREPVPVLRGTQIVLTDPACEYRVFFYSREIRPELIHTYTYPAEGISAVFVPEEDLSGGTGWRREALEIDEAGFVRIAVRRREEGPVPSWQDSIRICREAEEPLPEPAWMQAEADRLAARVEAKRKPGTLAFLLAADTHDTVGGNAPDTLRCLRLAAKAVRPQGLIHLGDLTDGMLPRQETESRAGRLLAGLRELGLPVWLCLGNHDANYFKGNPQPMTMRERNRFYLGRDRGWYAADLRDKKLRLIFLDSFAPERPLRYGFSKPQLLWFAEKLAATPRGWRVLIFSHVPPLPQIHVWSRRIRYGPRMLRTAETIAAKKGFRILAWIHGHNHADQIYPRGSFPIVSVGCSKTEDFPEHKPEGAVVPKRRQGEASQELFDVLLVHPEGAPETVRFGAGEDRILENPEAGA